MKLTCEKRRCVHDEFGNEDPAKLAEAAVPRPAAKRKKQSLPNGDTPVHKKQKRTSAASDIVIDPLLMMDPTNSSPIELSMQPIPTLQAQPPSQPDKIEEPVAVPVPIDPTLLDQSNNSAIIHPPIFSPEDEVTLIATSPLSDVKCEPPGDELHSVQVLPSSLVSPPESTNNDAERTPPTATVPIQSFTPPTTSASSRQSSSHPSKLLQNGTRLTPESVPARRHSNSFTNGAFIRESNSPAVSISVSGTPGASHKRQKSRTTSFVQTDEESLRLIRELQAQDLGLRRRRS